MALTDEGHARDALRAMNQALYTFGCILQDHRIDDPRLKDGAGNVWTDIREAADHIDAIRVRGDKEREEKAGE